MKTPTQPETEAMSHFNSRYQVIATYDNGEDDLLGHESTKLDAIRHANRVMDETDINKITVYDRLARKNTDPRVFVRYANQ